MVSFDDAKERVRGASDIVQVIGGYLPLRQQGANFVALCPFHDDSRPSLHVNPTRQIWRCFVCNVGGDVFSFVMKREKVEFPEALAILAERAGISLDKTGHAPAAPGSAGDKATLYRALEWAAVEFQKCLLGSAEAEPAREYLRQRGLAAASLARFQLGYAPDRWQWLLERAAKLYSAETLRAAGLALRSSQNERYYDQFRGRVMFPIRDPLKRVVAFGGRVLPELAAAEEKRTGRKPGKYVNSPETRLFSKSEQLYGLDVAREDVEKRRQVLVMEGYTDVIMAWQAGVPNAAAVLGTALGPRHVRLLRRYADQVVLVLDGDEAGRRRTNEILELFIAEQMDLRVLTLPDELDPCDYLRSRPVEDFNALVAQACDALEHKTRLCLRGVDPARDTHLAHKALEEILGVLARAPRLTAGGDSLARLREQQLVARLARLFFLEETEVRARLQALRRAKKPLETRGQPADDAAPAPRGDKTRERGPGSQVEPASPSDPVRVGEPDVEGDADVEPDFSELASATTNNAAANSAATSGDAARGAFAGGDQPAAAEPPSADWRALAPAEAELFEIMLRHPDLAPLVLEELPDEQLSSPQARYLLGVYRRLDHARRELNLAELLLALTDPAWQVLVVKLDELAAAKEPHAQTQPPRRLRGLMRHFQNEQRELQRRARLAAMQERRLDAHEELAFIEELIAHQRQRANAADPEDG